jgi:hypothetical protein
VFFRGLICGATLALYVHCPVLCTCKILGYSLATYWLPEERAPRAIQLPREQLRLENVFYISHLYGSSPMASISISVPISAIGTSKEMSTAFL